MSIPEAQLQVWSNQGAVITAQNTHNSIRTALEDYRWPDGVRYEAYLQGSYRNSTNIYGNSDVDLVVELTSAYWSNLTEEEKVKLGWERANYNWDQFRGDVIVALVNYYGNTLVDINGNKSIKVLPDNSGRLKADIVVSGSYRHYENLKIAAEGITFWTQVGSQQIINFPKLHYENGADKNSGHRTIGWYRKSTRMFKNARDKIVGEKPELKGRFPSYFIECLLYNVPDKCFRYSFQNIYISIVNWLDDQFDQNKTNEFVCQNDFYYLFGSNSVQWNISDARQLVNVLLELWSNW